MKEKTFYKILVEFCFSIEKTKRSLSDLRLTKIEKLIIEGHLKVRKNRNQEVFDSISGTTPSELPFVESQRQLLLGLVLLNLTHYKEAEKHFRHSIETLHKLNVPYFLFFSYHTLFALYDNLNETELMLQTIEAMKKTTTNKRQEAQLLICEFCYEQKMDNYLEAKTLLKKIDQSSKDLSEVDMTCHMLNQFMFYVQFEDLVLAKEVLDELKKCRNYQLTENYNFMKKMLDHLTKETPLYVYDQHFENMPFLLHQLKVIQALEEKKLDLAKQHWEALKVFSPKTYGENYQYIGPTCLFSLALKKHLSATEKPLQFISPVSNSKLEHLISILEMATSPVPAAAIFEMIWGNPPETKEDLIKVGRLIFRAKTEKNLDIKFRKGSYVLTKDLASKIS